MKWIATWLLCLSCLASADDAVAAKAKFDEQSKALQAAHAKLKTAKLPAELLAEIEKDQRSWTGYRDEVSKAQIDRTNPESTLRRWEKATEMTEERKIWIEAWSNLGKRKGWAGSYSDGRGGELKIIEKDGKFLFLLSVTRGAGEYMGLICGELRVNGKTAWFETNIKEGPTWVTLIEDRQVPGRIKITTEKAEPYHGKEAYFDESYLWTREVRGEDHEKVRKTIEFYADEDEE